MTPDEKRDRRAAKHEVQAAFKRLVLRRIGLFSTGPQIRSGIKILTERYISEQVKPAAKAIEKQTLEAASA